MAGLAAGDRFGFSVSAAGDVDGDGVDDLVVGAYGSNAGTGALHLYRSGTRYWEADTPVPDQTIDGTAAGDQFGVRVTTVQGIQGDAFDDVVVGANRASPGSTDQGEVARRG